MTYWLCITNEENWSVVKEVADTVGGKKYRKGGGVFY